MNECGHSCKFYFVAELRHSPRVCALAEYWRDVCPCLRRRRNTASSPVSTSTMRAITDLRRICTRLHDCYPSHSCFVAGNALASIPKPAEREASAHRRPPLIEAPDSHMSALAASNKVIQISNLRKEFTSSGDKSVARVAVDGVDLTMYEVWVTFSYCISCGLWSA